MAFGDTTGVRTQVSSTLHSRERIVDAARAHTCPEQRPRPAVGRSHLTQARSRTECGLSPVLHHEYRFLTIARSNARYVEPS